MRRKGFIILGVIFLIIVIAVISGIIWYNISIKKPNKDESQEELSMNTF